MTDAVLNLDTPFRLIVENVVDYAIFTLDVHGQVTSWNIGAERIKKYRPEEIIGRNFSVFYPAEDIAAGKPEKELKVASEAGRFEDEGWRLRRDGSRFWANVIITALRDERGTLHGFVKLTRDLTERRQEELETRRGREIFRHMVEAAPSALVMINGQGTIEMINRQAELMFGYDRSELLGRPVETLVPARYRQRHPEMRGSFFSDLKSRPMGAGRDLYALRKDGSEFPVEIGLNPIEIEREAAADNTLVLSAIVDITDRKQREAHICAALEEKNILLAEIHHRVKNNLQIVHSLLDLQSSRLTDQAAIEMLNDSKNRVNSMALIHQILYQSKDFAEIDFRSVLDSLVPVLVQSYRISSAFIEVSVNAEPVPLALNVAISCGLVVNELISNALKHAFPGGRAGKLSISMRHDGSGMVALTVEDDGVGIPAEIDFDTASTLGLQLVQLLTSQLHGELSVHRTNPTRFSIIFPAARGERGGASEAAGIRA